MACNDFPPSGKDDELAQILYDFQDRLVKEGIDFIANLRKSNAQPYQTINVVVLGDITEDQTQLLFPSSNATKGKGTLPTSSYPSRYGDHGHAVSSL